MWLNKFCVFISHVILVQEIFSFKEDHITGSVDFYWNYAIEYLYNEINIHQKIVSYIFSTWQTKIPFL